MFDTSETGRGPWALRPKAPALLRPFFTSFQQTPARGVQRASVSARRFGSTWTAPIVRYAHLRPPCSAFWPSVPRPVAGRGPGGALGPGRVSGDCGPPGHVSSRSGSRTTTTAWALLAPAFLASLLVCTTSSNHGRFSRQLFHIQEPNPDGASFRRHVGHLGQFQSGSSGMDLRV